MTTYSKLILSGSTNGKQIKVAANATPGTTIHTAVAGNDDKDEIYLYAVNSSSAPVKLTIEWGGTASPDDLIELTLLPQCGLVPVVPGLVLNGGLVVKAFAAVADVIMISGYVNRVATS